jgi:hypothetical protein
MCCLSILCAYFAQVDGTSPSGSQYFIANQNTVKSIDGISETTFDHICINYENGSLSSIVSPLSNKARAGKSATLLLGCASSRSCFYELVCTCAGQLIQPAAGASSSVTVSWFTIGADGSEDLTDELHRASARSAPEAVGKAPELHLRELGNGRGMLIPGLWEIECATEADVRAVVQHVQARLPHLAAASSRESQHHSVFQLSYGDRKKDSAGKKAPGAKKDFVAMGALADRAAVGRVTFIQLGALLPQPAAHSDEHGAPPSPKKGDVHDSAATTLHPWVHHLKTVMTLLENRQASTPFHRCRLVLLLKDILLRRQSGAVVLSLQQAGGVHSTDTEWLQLFAQLTRLTGCRVPAQPIAAPSDPAPAAAPRARSRLNSAASATSLGDAVRAATSTASAAAEEDGRSRSAGRAVGPRLFRSSSIHQAGVGAELAQATAAMAAEEKKAANDAKPKR